MAIVFLLLFGATLLAISVLLGSIVVFLCLYPLQVGAQPGSHRRIVIGFIREAEKAVGYLHEPVKSALHLILRLFRDEFALHGLGANMPHQFYIVIRVHVAQQAELALKQKQF